MKKNIILILVLGFIACNKHSESSVDLLERIDSLEKKLTDTYKPGFGEFMSSVQAHHSKLWFAGLNQNWKLADFEVHELMEAIENIKKFQAGRKESQIIEMLNPSIDSVNSAIRQKDAGLFKSSFVLLTNSCNTCHKETNFEFNIVKLPETSPFSNQEFNLTASK